MEVIQEKVAIMAGKKIEAPVDPLPEIQAESLQIAEKPPEIEPDPASPIIPDPIAAPVVEPVPPVVIVTTTSTTLKKVKKVPPPKKQEFEVEVKNVEIQFKKPTPLERFKGQKPVLFAKWPFDENTKNYRVQIFRIQLSSNVKNNNLGDPRITEKPIVDLKLS